MSEIVVRVADLGVGSADDVLVTVGLGSCVAIILHDPGAQVGGMAHVLLPSPALSRSADNPAKFPQLAVPRLVELMTARGASERRLVARIAGGASMFANLAPAGAIQMGERNVVATRQALQAAGVPLVAEAVGGDFGRTVRFFVGDGRVEVSSVAHGTQPL
ncbi:MAG TPA: chemotaxis protein CheD [Gemmatimonadales bacterium]|jgi:chemotaxis protein CheD|nr:chemotaxis protein CheD [Gemmatimonadales bacterium]